jgi:hypothetical protein
MMKVLVLALFMTSLTFAATDPGGGVGVVCYKDDKIASVELLDLYEARAKGLNFQTGLTAQKVTTKIFKNDDYLYDIQNIKTLFRPITKESALELNPGNYPLFLPRGCKMEQITKFYNNKTIWQDKALYDMLDENGKLALLFHEYIYLKERSKGGEDSRYTRLIVGLAFSTQDPFESEDKLMKDFEGTACMSEDMKTTFMATLKDPVKKTWVFRFTELNAHKMYSTKSAEFAVVPDLSQSFMKEKDTGKKLVSTRVLQSKINPKESMTVKSTANRLYISWKGTDPQDELKDVEFRCGDDAQEWF